MYLDRFHSNLHLARVRFFVRRIFVKERMAEAAVDDDAAKGLTLTHEVRAVCAVWCACVRGLREGVRVLRA